MPTYRITLKSGVQFAVIASADFLARFAQHEETNGRLLSTGPSDPCLIRVADIAAIHFMQPPVADQAISLRHPTKCPGCHSLHDYGGAAPPYDCGEGISTCRTCAAQWATYK